MSRQVKSKLCDDQRSVGQCVLVSSTILVPQDMIFIPVIRLRICRCEVPSLTRGRIYFLLALASAFILVSESREVHDHILLTQIRHSPTWRPRSWYVFPILKAGPVIPQGTGFPFRHLLRLAGILWGVFLPASTLVLTMKHRHGSHRKRLLHYCSLLTFP
jgi:hypothetical protein